jgi:AraC family transcriptional regulator
VSEMAAICRMSVRHFHRNFLKSYGVTPNKYLQLRRLEMAKDLLADPDLSIEEAAARCGFFDAAFFRTVFTRETGLTPSLYRKRVATG